MSDNGSPKTLMIRDDVLAPEPSFTFDYKGKNPSSIIRDIGDILMDAFVVKGKNTYNREIKWHTSETGVSFYANWLGKDGIDANTTFYIEIRVIGKEDKATKEGNVSIVTYPYLVTKVPIKSSLHRMYWFFYSIVFYNKKRVAYINKYRNAMATYKTLLTQKYGLGVST